MKKVLSGLLGFALLLSLLTACGGGKPATVKEGDAKGLPGYLTGSGNEEYMLTEDAVLDLTGVDIARDRTVLLQGDVTLRLTGTLTPGEGCITVRAAYDNNGAPALDLSGLAFAPAPRQEATLLTIRSDVKLSPPVPTETLAVDASNEEWTGIRSVLPPEKEPEAEPGGPGSENDNSVSTAAEVLQAFEGGKARQIELAKDVAVELAGTVLSHDLSITCNSHLLTLSGELNMQGGILEIGEKPNVEVGTADISGLTVNCERSAYASGTNDIVFIGLNFKHIIGEPTLGDDLLYEIPDSGENASVKLKEVITPEMHEAKLKEDLTRYLSGAEFNGGVDIDAKFLADGVLEIYLDNPVIDRDIGVGIDGNMSLIITGSVTFDGGNYGFELRDASGGTATVDITGLEIHGTQALGTAKSPDIFKITGNQVNLLYNEGDPHIQAVQNDQFWLRYVQ